MKYQLTCPKCKHEFAYNNGYLDRNITRLGCEIQDIIMQLNTERKVNKIAIQKENELWKL